MALNEGRHTETVIRLEQLNQLFDMTNNLNVEFTAGHPAPVSSFPADAP